MKKTEKEIVMCFMFMVGELSFWGRGVKTDSMCEYLGWALIGEISVRDMGIEKAIKAKGNMESDKDWVRLGNSK